MRIPILVRWHLYIETAPCFVSPISAYNKANNPFVWSYFDLFLVEKVIVHLINQHWLNQFLHACLRCPLCKWQNKSVGIFLQQWNVNNVGNWWVLQHNDYVLGSLLCTLTIYQSNWSLSRCIFSMIYRQIIIICRTLVGKNVLTTQM